MAAANKNKVKANPIQGTRQDTWKVSVRIEDIADGNWMDMGIWDTKTGGEVDSEERLYYPGAMQPPYSLGGRVNPGQVTVSRNYRLQRDGERLQKIINGVGSAQVEITQAAMSRKKEVYGKWPLVYTGTLKTVTLPEHNSESTSDPSMIEITVTVDKPPTAH